MIIVETTSGQYRDRAARLLPNLNRIESLESISESENCFSRLLSSLAQEIRICMCNRANPSATLRTRLKIEVKAHPTVLAL